MLDLRPITIHNNNIKINKNNPELFTTQYLN